ncbi:hypothetical protein D3C73_557270 [compost metagenome]
MAIHTFKDNPFTINLHQPIFDFELAEAYLRARCLYKFTLLIMQGKHQRIQVRFLRTPFLWVIHRYYTLNNFVFLAMYIYLQLERLSN